MNLAERLADPRPLLIDGGTGTEMEKRGVPMHEKGWSAHSTLVKPETLCEIHEDYIDAGAEIIITNTFSTSRHVLEACGLADRFEKINREAVRIARQARENAAKQPVWVAGSISTTTFFRDQPPIEEARANFTAQAEILAEEGVDLFMLEMMRDIEYTQLVMECAQGTGLPVWVGFSTFLDEAGTVRLTESKRKISLADALQSLSLAETPMVSIMHTLTEDIEPSLDILQRHWSGPIGVYAHSGEFIMPNWQFIDMITPEEYADEVQRWIARGVGMVGGCCGIGPAHIRQIRERIQEN